MSRLLRDSIEKFLSCLSCIFKVEWKAAFMSYKLLCCSSLRKHTQACLDCSRMVE